MAEKPKPKEPERPEADAWSAFERTVDAVMKSPPKPRKPSRLQVPKLPEDGRNEQSD